MMTGERYIGDWVNNGKIGIGIFIKALGTYYYKDRSKYEGEWQHDKRNGKGRLTMKNGEYYDGEWKSNEMNGKGIYNK